MKKDQLLISIIILSTIIVILILFLFAYSKREVIFTEENQIEMLTSLYNDFISNFNTESKSITLDESCFYNFITNEVYSDENIKKLKSVEVYNPNERYNYVIHFKYDIKTNTFSINMVNKSNEGEYQKQSYKISVKNNKVVYKRDGLLEGFMI